MAILPDHSRSFRFHTATHPLVFPFRRLDFPRRPRLVQELKCMAAFACADDLWAGMLAMNCPGQLMAYCIATIALPEKTLAESDWSQHNADSTAGCL